MELEGEPAGNCGSGLSHVAADHPGITCGADRMLTINRLERDVEISVETIALFIRYWLTAIPSLQEHTRAAARAKGGERYEGFMQALGRRLAKGPGFIKEVTLDVRPPGFSKSEIGEDSA